MCASILFSPTTPTSNTPITVMTMYFTEGWVTSRIIVSNSFFVSFILFVTVFLYTLCNIQIKGGLELCYDGIHAHQFLELLAPRQQPHLLPVLVEP